MPQAARVEDQVSHTEAQQQAVGESLKGALFGVLIGAAIVGLTIATGGADLVVAGAAIAAGGTVLGMAGRGFLQGEKEGAQVTTPEGPILTGSGNVTVNGRAAAIACGSEVNCKEHGPSKKVAQGSRTVSINGKMAARVGDRGTCGFVIGQGSDTVSIGGPVGTCAAISQEVPDWENTLAHGAVVVGDAAVLVGSVMSGVGALRAIAAAPAALRGLMYARFGAGLAAGLGFGAGGGYVGGRVFGQGSWQQQAMATGGALFGGMAGDAFVSKGPGMVAGAQQAIGDAFAPQGQFAGDGPMGGLGGRVPSQSGWAADRMIPPDNAPTEPMQMSAADNVSRGGAPDETSGLDSGDASQSSQANYDRANQLSQDLPKAYDGKTVASDAGSDYLSGSGGKSVPVPDGYSRVPVADVKDYGQSVGYDFPPAKPGFLDRGDPGSFYASHAEPQALAAGDGGNAGVNRSMCGSCQNLYRQSAIARGETLTPQDPNGQWAFNPDGTVVRPDGGVIGPDDTISPYSRPPGLVTRPDGTTLPALPYVSGDQ